MCSISLSRGWTIPSLELVGIGSHGENQENGYSHPPLLNYSTLHLPARVLQHFLALAPNFESFKTKTNHCRAAFGRATTSQSSPTAARRSKPPSRAPTDPSLSPPRGVSPRRYLSFQKCPSNNRPSLSDRAADGMSIGAGHGGPAGLPPSLASLPIHLIVPSL